MHILFLPAAVLLVCGLLFLGAFLAVSPGKPEPFPDENGLPLEGSISEKIRIDINGVEQGMFIRSRDKTYPVLLYLHGGMPEYFLDKRYHAALEELFTVVWWEQRGSGISYSPDIPRQTMTTEQLISDTIELTNELRRRFGKDRIYLMGHSGGSFIGIQAAARAPGLYHAYLGMAQMSCQLRSECLAREYMIERFRENGNRSMAKKLEAAPVTMTGGIPAAYLAVRDKAMHSLGIGTTREMKSVITGIVLPSLLCRDYTLREKVHLWLGKIRSGVSMIWDDMLATDLAELVPELQLPVYFFEGIYDYTCSFTEAKSYFEKLKAPLKGFYIFAFSAHSPMFEESEKMRKILKEDVLAGVNKLADLKETVSEIHLLPGKAL
ncbi:MAG: alpha/beta hydrolase [Chlorobiaceae bacterium]|nr:alpha/beta hydrolase [Chlorobiaceae bacterium]